jgi:hypothetical protein
MMAGLVTRDWVVVVVVVLVVRSFPVHRNNNPIF